MEFRDLKKQYEVLKKQIDTAVIDVISSGKYINGPWVTELEDELSEYIGTKHCITCGNGTDALTMALMVWDIKDGDAVFVPDFTFFSTGEVVSLAGATPVFVDVNMSTFNMDPDALERMIISVIDEGVLKPKAVIPVDLFGLPANHSKIRSIANKYDLLVCEDGAQGFGGSIDGKMACSFGDISSTSFFPAKPLGCYGDGGAIFTDNDEYANLLRSIRIHGKGFDKYDNVRIGLNSRLDSIQAAILKVKLSAFKEYELRAMNEIAKMYNESFKECEVDIITTPEVPKGYVSSWAQYTIRCRSNEIRKRIQIKLKNEGIPCMIYYVKPMHEQKAFGSNAYYNDRNDTKALCETVLSLPIHPYMESTDVHRIVEIIANNKQTERDNEYN